MEKHLYTNNLDIQQQILDKIKSYNRIIITRHKRPDGDAIGSSKGLASLLKLNFPQKEIYLQTEDSSNYLAFLGQDDPTIADELYADALLIVTDTANLQRISNSKVHLAKEIIKIDHHIDIAPYGNLSWVEDLRSSASEMIATFYDTFKNELKIDSQTATYIYTGMVTDSGRFRYESTTGDTMRLAGALMDVGINTDWLFANLYLQEFDSFKFESYVHEKMKITPNGVAYIHVDKKMQQKFDLNLEQASEAVSFLNSIKGSIVWLAFIDCDDGTIRVRLRSRFMEINKLAEKYGGGGHQCTCGATLTSKKQIKLMLDDADKMIADYKSTHEGWL